MIYRLNHSSEYLKHHFIPPQNPFHELLHRLKFELEDSMGLGSRSGIEVAKSLAVNR
jgi:hypothetical protein